MKKRKGTGDGIEILDLGHEDEDIRRAERIEQKTIGRRNRQYMQVTMLVLIMLLAMAAYFCYFLFAKSESFINNSYNRRLVGFSDKVTRGDIITSDGVVVATSKLGADGKETRSYPKGREYAHAVGFNTNGMLGIEKDYNFSLLRSHAFILNRIKNEVESVKNPGDTVVSSIDSRLQDIAYSGLGNYRGAVVAMDADTGEIICMVSKPDFDPNSIEANWEAISSQEGSSVLLNRVTQGLYPPGSVFKIFTALEYLREGGHPEDTYNCEGKFTFDDHTIHCYKGSVHGVQTFEEAFAHSCNSVFANIAVGQDQSGLKRLCDAMLFNKPLPTQLSPVSNSFFDISNDSGYPLIMQTGIGQGNTLVTPLHMLMVCAAIAKDGVVVKPRLVSRIQNVDGITVRNVVTETSGSILSRAEAGQIKEFMRQTVISGTAKRLNNDSYTAYGKTGTAEFSSNRNEAHSWFCGFAEKGGKKIAISVIMEGAGSGSEHAVPLAKEILDSWSSRIDP